MEENRSRLLVWLLVIIFVSWVIILISIVDLLNTKNLISTMFSLIFIKITKEKWNGLSPTSSQIPPMSGIFYRIFINMVPYGIAEQGFQ